MEVAPGGVGILLTADVPDALLEATAPDADDPAAAVLERLPHGVTLTVDGAQVPLTVAAQGRRVDLVGGSAQVLTLRLVADVDLAGRHTVVVGNANLGDAPCWFRDDVWVPPVSTVHGTNLVQTRRGRTSVAWGRWSRSEGLRRVDLDVEVPDDAVSAAFRAVSTVPWSLDDAAPTAALTAWARGRTDPTSAGLAMALSAVLGLGAGLASRRTGRLLVGGLFLWAASAALPALPAGPLAVLAAVGALLVVLDPAWGALAALATVPWVGASVGIPWTVATGIAWVAGVAVARGTGGSGVSPGRAAALITAAAVLASLRG
ncbi:MAG: hypothetical protein H6733_02225 [Alphaproteobacteria bacterium]|nr:hypothetical protein [Alphaproteobacteria bacterium]